MTLTFYLECGPVPGQRNAFDVEVNDTESAFIKRLLSENSEVRDRFGSLYWHDNALYITVKKKARKVSEEVFGNDLIKSDDQIKWDPELLKETYSEDAKASSAECALFYEVIGGELITNDNLIGFRFREHFSYDPLPRMVTSDEYPACTTVECDIFGQDERRWNRRATYSQAWCGTRPDSNFLTVEYYGDPVRRRKIKMVSVQEDSWTSLLDCAERMRRVIRLLRKGQPYANPDEIARSGAPEQEK